MSEISTSAHLVSPPESPPRDPPSHEGESPEPPSHEGELPPARWSWTTRGAVGLVIIAVILLLGIAPTSHRVAASLPAAPPDPTAVPAGSDRPGTSSVRTVPVGLPAGATIRTADDVRPYAVAALGSVEGDALIALLGSSVDLPSTPVGYFTAHLVYPYDYPAMTRILDAAPTSSFVAGATALGAALTALAAQPQVFTLPTLHNTTAILNAGAAAYAVLNRARASGRCDPQLDLLLLVSSDDLTSADTLRQEAQRTEAACPQDPTPGWIVGESQLRHVPLTLSATSVSPGVVAPLQAAITTFTALVARYPGDTGAITGLGDATLRAASHLRVSEPFTARAYFRSALADYVRAAALGDRRDAVPGLARTLIGLGEPGQAARLLDPLTSSSTRRGPLLEVLIEADESAHDFTAAQADARALLRLGPSSYPNGTGVFPAPAAHSIDALDDTTLLQSWGTDRLRSLSATLIAPGGAGGSVQDLSFIPAYRDAPGVTGSQPSCPDWTWRRDAILSGQAAEALVGWPSTFLSVRPGQDGCFEAGALKGVAEVVAGRKPDQSNLTSDDLADARQNLLRWAGDLPAAKQVAERWQSADGDKSATPALRLGEIDFLAGRYYEAAAQFAVAAHRARLLGYNDDLAVDQDQLDQGTALLAAGRTAQAVALLRPLDELGTQGYAYQNSLPNGAGFTVALKFATVSYYACVQLADHERESGDLHAAVEDYATALDWTTQLEQGSGVRPEALNNDAALAYLGLGDTATAAGLARTALAVDPKDPAFLMTAGFIADRAGDVSSAASDDRQALASDPGAFPAANDLGVELTRQGHNGSALTALRRAVGADPHYALGWFNLGILESRMGPAHLLAAQGALAKAYALDPELKGRRHVVTIDAAVYRTALDLSKPLPPRWTFTQLPQPAPVAALGLLAVVSLGVGLARTSGRGGAPMAQQWLDPIDERLGSVPLLQRLAHPSWACGATVVAFVLAYLRQGVQATELVYYAIGVLVLGGAAMTARTVLGHVRHVRLRQGSWLLGMAFGLVSGAAGFPWAPLPVIREDSDDARMHLAAPVTLALLSVLLFIESAALHVPLAQSFAVAALIMAASTLVPVGPLDGAHLGKAGAVAGAGLIGGAVLVAVGLI